MNILFVTDFYKPHIGGVEKLFSSLAEELVRQNNNVTFITWRYDKKLVSREIINGVNVIRINSPTRLIFSIVALKKIITCARKSDIIHTSTYSSAIGAWVAGKITGKKILLTVHEVWGNLWLDMPFITGFEKRVFRRFERWLLKLNFNIYIAVSDFTRDKLASEGIDPCKILRIYNGIDYNFPQWNNQGVPFTFCFFGRAGTSKGLDILIVAAEKFVNQYPEVRFKFIISPQIKKVYQKVTLRIKNGILKDYSQFYSELPYSSLMNELLKTSCIIIPSLCEGFGFTAVEASAMNIPVISSGMGSLPEVVSGKVITMQKYTADDLYLAMEACIHNQFETVKEKRFTVEEFVKSHTTLYKGLVR